MHYEVWGKPYSGSGNIIGEFDTEAEALALVRELVDDGWAAEELGMGLAPDESDPGDVALPTWLSGSTLKDALARQNTCPHQALTPS